VANLDVMLARINEVMERGTFKGVGEWCLAAGISRSYISTLRSRGGSKRRGGSTGARYDEVAKLARAAGVGVSWLMGDTDDDTLPSEENMSTVDRALMTFDWPPDLPAPLASEVFKRAREEAATAADLNLKYWLNRLSGIVADVRDEHDDGSDDHASSRRRKRSSG
jgi:hypothetical protein